MSEKNIPVEYYAEHIGGVGGAMDTVATVARWNELGGEGWRLICLFGSTAVFMRELK